ncbi:hypothetical protein ACFWDZ_32875 [Micromonospora aurantiaca]|uniref:hypothetical protein n=1 Tax=Micromonospora aurantiaca (nom. illeg.) TaxID=47850 RepID=UPI0036687C92
MGLLSRIFGSREQTTRYYPATGVSVTGDAGRYRRAKTREARDADRKAEKWEQQHRRRFG